MQPQSRVQKIMEGVGLKICIMVDVHIVAFCEENITFIPKYYEDIDGFSHTHGKYEVKEHIIIFLGLLICIMFIIVNSCFDIYTLAR